MGDATTIRSEFRSPRLVVAVDGLLILASVAAIATLVMLYGGFRPHQLPLSRQALFACQRGIVVLFIFDRLVRLLLARHRGAFLRKNWLYYALLAVLFVAVGVLFWQQMDARVSLFSAGALYLILTEGYLLAMLILRGVGANVKLAGSGLPPSWLLIGSFAAICLIGSGLLMLPAAVEPEFRDAWHYGDSLFTATSATCVTGLVVVGTGSHFTVFGQTVLLVLIQLGGLGIMIFGTMLAMLAGKALSMRGSETVGEMLREDRLGELTRVIRFVVVATFILEALGALLLLSLFLTPGVRDVSGQAFTLASAVWYAVFHSVSAFCNAGFSLYDANFAAGAGDWGQPLREHWQVLGVVAPLILLGGLGFPVLDDLARLPRAWWRRWRQGRRKSTSLHRKPLPRFQLTLHSKLVLITTACLLLFGAGGLCLLESQFETAPGDTRANTPAAVEMPNDWRAMSPGSRVREAAFLSVSSRTAGFNTNDLSHLTDASKLWLCSLMTIGGSPGGTAGGIKTVTIALMILSTWCVLRRRDDLEVFGRHIPAMLLRRAVTVLVLYLTLLLVVTLVLCAAMRGEAFLDLFFEACSACGTVGLSTGVTPRLGSVGQGAVILGMFIGRIGPTTVLLAMMLRAKPSRYSYPHEYVAIG